jgi:uncharacterized membrane protein (DUF485 family)
MRSFPKISCHNKNTTQDYIVNAQYAQIWVKYVIVLVFLVSIIITIVYNLKANKKQEPENLSIYYTPVRFVQLKS